MTTQRVLQQGLVLSPSHPVGVTLLGFMSARARVSCKLSLLIKLSMDTSPESLTDTQSRHIWIFRFVSSFCLALLSFFFFFLVSVLICYHILHRFGDLKFPPLGFTCVEDFCRFLHKIKNDTFSFSLPSNSSSFS